MHVRITNYDFHKGIFYRNGYDYDTEAIPDCIANNLEKGIANNPKTTQLILNELKSIGNDCRSCCLKSKNHLSHYICKPYITIYFHLPNKENKHKAMYSGKSRVNFTNYLRMLLSLGIQPYNVITELIVTETKKSKITKPIFKEYVM